MRKIFFFLFLSLSMMVCLGHGSRVEAQQESFPYLAEVTGDSVNVRAGQSTNFERVCQLNKGDEVVVLEKAYGWYKIQMPSEAKIYVSKLYVQYLGQNAGGVTADRVNIRAGAGTHHTVVGQLFKGEQIFIDEELDEWYRIQPVAESNAWISDQYLKFKSNDVVVYQSTVYARPAVEDHLFDPVEESEDQAQEEAAGEKEDEIFSAEGYVEKYEDKDNDGIHYKIVIKGRPVCYILGVNHMLGRFVHQKVSVKGTINKKLQSKYAYPVIIVSKVRLLL